MSAEEKGPKKTDEGRKRKKQIGLWQLYNVDYAKKSVSLKNKKCPRCGKIMARHESPQRFSCGGCGYTEYDKKK